jgi:hypothetical protein
VPLFHYRGIRAVTQHQLSGASILLPKATARFSYERKDKTLQDVWDGVSTQKTDVVPGGVVVSLLAIGHKMGSDPAGDDGFLRAIKSVARFVSERK